MAEVLSVKSVPSKKRIEIILFNGEEKNAYTVSEATYRALGSPSAGSVISEADYGTLCFEDECHRALKRAMGYLSLSDKSRFELRMKLVRQGYSAEASDTALERLIEFGYLDEERQLERAVEKEANYKLRGRYYIKRKLSSKGYSQSAVNRAIDKLTESGEVDFSANLEKLLEKKCATSDEERTALEYKFGYRI